MADQTIFEDSTAPQPAANTVQDPLVSTLVGEGKKYKTVDELAKAYMNADEFVETLKSENRELRDKVAAAASIDEVLKKLETKTEQDDSPVKPEGTLSASDVAELVRTTITGLETTKSREANLRKADGKMKEVFGDKAEEVYKKAAATPEMHRAFMALAEVDPDSFLRLFTTSTSTVGTQTDSGSVASRAIELNSGGDRSKMPGTKEYYSAMRRADPNRYYSQATQLEMDRAARDDSKRFYGR